MAYATRASRYLVVKGEVPDPLRLLCIRPSSFKKGRWLGRSGRFVLHKPPRLFHRWNAAHDAARKYGGRVAEIRLTVETFATHKACKMCGEDA